MMKLPFQGQHSLKPTAVAFSVVLYGWLLLGSPSVAPAAEADLKPGETIGPQNWQKIQGMVGENLLSRIKAGYTLQIKTPKVYRPLKEYVEATEKYSAELRCRATVSKARPQRPADWPETRLELFLSLVGRRLQNRGSGKRGKDHTRRYREGRVGAPRRFGFLLSFSEHPLFVESQTRDPRL